MDQDLNLRDQLKKALDGYCRRTGEAPSMIAKKLFNNASFFDRVLNKGRNCSIEKFEQAMRYLHSDLLGVD
jgi:hypothetical protein